MGLNPARDRSVAEGRRLLILNYFAWQASSLNRSLNRRLVLCLDSKEECVLELPFCGLMILELATWKKIKRLVEGSVLELAQE